MGTKRTSHRNNERTVKYGEGRKKDDRQPTGFDNVEVNIVWPQRIHGRSEAQKKHYPQRRTRPSAGRQPPPYQHVYECCCEPRREAANINNANVPSTVGIPTIA